MGIFLRFAVRRRCLDFGAVSERRCPPKSQSSPGKNSRNSGQQRGQNANFWVGN